ncbi:MAG TPA: hypothetical protein VGB76_18555, partial [Pyrinomonadaceae bacterium]
MNGFFLRPAFPFARNTQASTGTTFVITNNNDSGAGSLRDAITAANASPGTDTIAFNLPPGAQKIEVGLAFPLPLPDITDPLIIDGTTQPGYDGKPLVVLSGAKLFKADSHGLTILSGSTVVKSLVINGFVSAGIHMKEKGGNVVQNCYIGTDPGGTQHVGNNAGVYLLGSSGNLIGGAAAGDGNVLAGNRGPDIHLGIGSHSNQVSGNMIGTDVSGSIALKQGSQTFSIFSGSNNVIGGNTPGARNVIIGGLTIDGDTPYGASTGNHVKGNYIGLNRAGTAALNPVGSGVSIGSRSTGNLIGGTTPGERNIISGNGTPGVVISG